MNRFLSLLQILVTAATFALGGGPLAQAAGALSSLTGIQTARPAAVLQLANAPKMPTFPIKTGRVSAPNFSQNYWK